MMRRLALAALVPAFLLSACAGSKSRLKVGQSPDGEVVEAEGLAPYDATDLIKTKRTSLVDAQRNAVEKAVGVYVTGKTLVDKAVAIENNILARTDGYIKKYDIVSEGPDGAFYKTRIRALVAVHDLERDLKDLALLKEPELQRPKVTVSLTEEVDKAIVDDGAAATALEKVLQDQGFTVLPAERAKEADLLIKGKASAFPFESAHLGGFVSYRSRLSVQAVRPGTETVARSVTREASGLGGSADLAALKSLESVGELVGNDLAGNLSASWTSGKDLLVYVEGVPSFADVEKIRTALSGKPGVADLMLRSYDEKMAQFDVQLSNAGNAADLSKAIESPDLKVLEANGQTIRLQRTAE